MARKGRADAGPLGTFGGYPVSGMSIAVRNAGDGLSDSLDITPNPHDTGTEFYLVLKCVTGPIDHEPVDAVGKKVKGIDLAEKGFAGYRRVEDAMTLQALEVPEDAVRTWLEEENVRIMAAKNERDAAERRARGEFSLDDAAAEQGANGTDA
jgi:hypothetical protein